jgi:hypothetical protein
MMNGPVHVHCSIMPMIVSSAAEAETGGAYYKANGKDAVPLRTALEEMGHPQGATPMECDNTTAVGIINDTIRQRRSKAMEMRFYWIKDRQKQGQFRLYWASGSKNRADCLLHQTPFSGASPYHATVLYAYTYCTGAQAQATVQR